MEDTETFTTFTRTWWRENPAWPNGLEPWLGDKTYHASELTRAEAVEMCEEYNSTHDPGRLSLKMEFESE